MFAPLTKWEVIKEQVDRIKEYAEAYENAYNTVEEQVQEDAGIDKVLRALPQAAKVQVDKETERLVEARRIAKTEKGAYVRVGVG